MPPSNSSMQSWRSDIHPQTQTLRISESHFHPPNQKNASLTPLPSATQVSGAEAEMAAMATSTAIAGLGGSRLSLSRPSSRPSLSSGFLRSQVASRNPLKQKLAAGGRFTCFERDWLRTDLNVIGFGLIGWLAPSSIPVINGNSLTGLFFSSIGAELAHFPTGPALTSQFWLWLVTWHIGLFLCLTFGQIGFKGRTEDYF